MLDQSDDSSLSTSSITESDSTENYGRNTSFLETPRKKRYSKSIKHGLSQKRARYHLKSSSTNGSFQIASSSKSEFSDTANHSSTACFDEQQQALHILSDSSPTDLEQDSRSNSYIESDDSIFSEWSSSEESSSDSFVSMSYPHEEGNGAIDDESRNMGAEAQKPIYEGCNHSLLTSYTSVMLFVMKHSLSKEAFTDLLLLIATHLPVSCAYSKSIYRVKEFLKDFIDVKEPKTHIMCENCHQILDGEHCTSIHCRNKGAKILEFHDLHLQDQLKNLFRDRIFYDWIKNHKQQRQGTDRGDCITDICDGSQYKKVMLSCTQEDRMLNLTFTMNTDGVALFSSSKKGNLWPIYLAINEIPIKLRFSKKYILTSYLYCHSEKPNMLTYMSPQMETLKKLSDEGMEVMTPDGRLLIRAHLLAVTVDLPAKAMVANMKQFNGKFGCSFCMDEGETRPSCPMQRFWPFKEQCTLRNHQSYEDDVKKAVRLKNAVNGVKGASALLVLRYVDIPKVFVIDWMHCVLLGVTKTLMKLWFSSSYRENSFYIGDKITFLNQRLQKIEIPDFVSRTQRSLEDHAHWKASECREWLLHFSVPVLDGVLPPLMYVHYTLLVSAINLLNKEKVQMDEISYAEILLLDFCRVFPEVYGQFHQTMNVHLLRHLPHFVKLYGPLFTISCFGFESMNAHLKSMVHGTRFINSQISFAVAVSKSLPQLVKTFSNLNKEVQLLSERLSSKLIRSEYKEDPNTDHTPEVVGKTLRFIPAREDKILMENFKQENKLSDALPFKFFRLKKNSEVFYSRQYQRAKRRNSYTVLLDNADIAIVQHYLSIDGHLSAMVEKLNTVDTSVPICDDLQQHNVLRKYQTMQVCHHIKEVLSHEHFKIIPVSCIKKKCVYMKLNNGKTFVSIPPNLLEHN